MKQLNKILFAVLIVISISIQAQNTDNPWAISAGVNAVDYITSDSAPGDSWGEQHFNDLFNVSEYWNISAPYISVSRFIGKNFSVGLQGSYNKIKKFPYYAPNTPEANDHGYAVYSPDADYISADLFVKYSFMSLIKSKVIDPSLSLGGGYIFGGAGYYTVNGGFGLTFWVTEHIGLTIGTNYKWTDHIDRPVNTTSDEYPSRSHFQHTAGVTYQFGGKDTDKDGVKDKKDACIDVPGLKEFDGCPDTDGDGIIDGSDDCPDAAGLDTLKGCPDTDGDGVADKDDKCPNEKGLSNLKGCPDADGDGVADKDDKCPNEAGSSLNNGCPMLDADGDGVADDVDECPTVAGSVAGKGCPEGTVPDEVTAKLNSNLIHFAPGKATLLRNDAETTTSLGVLSEILKAYPDVKWTIEGHTDGTGSDRINQVLSVKRANALKDALIKSGVNADSLIAVGLSDTQPIATNKTVEGRGLNRRVEVKYIELNKK